MSHNIKEEHHILLTRMSLYKTSVQYTHHYSLPYIDRFIVEGEELYQYMLEHFESMFNEYHTLIFVDIRYFSDSCRDHVKEVTDTCGDDIIRAYSIWLLQEKEKVLFNKENWQIYRNRDEITDMYLGYRILFVYQQYYFQVSYDSYFFVLGLYGWKDESCEALQPDRRSIILSDHIMPERDWYYSAS